MHPRFESIYVTFSFKFPLMVFLLDCVDMRETMWIVFENGFCFFRQNSDFNIDDVDIFRISLDELDKLFPNSFMFHEFHTMVTFFPVDENDKVSFYFFSKFVDENIGHGKAKMMGKKSQL